MITDINRAREAKYDLCVIGSGPLGIILTIEFSRLNPNAKILLLEYGAQKEKPSNLLDDSIEVVHKLNHHEPYECTNKVLGGSSKTWGGRCVMFDEVDFIDRPILNGQCTWDLDFFNTIKPYIGRASEYFECGEGIFDLNKIKEFQNKRITEGFKEGYVLDSRLERWSMPTRFGKKYSNEILSKENIHVIFEYFANTFEKPDSSGHVSRLKIRSAADNSEERIQAKVFAISAGTQETTRILLRNQQLFDRVGGPAACLGKFYQGHISGKIASVQFNSDPKTTEYGFIKHRAGIYLRRRFQFTTEKLVSENLLSTALWLDNPLYHDPAHGSGSMSFMYLMMLVPGLSSRLAPPAIRHSITKGKKSNIIKHIANILRGLPDSLYTPAKIFVMRYLHERKLPGIFLYNKRNNYALHFHAEQVPSEENKMELASDEWTLNIQYSITDDDINSVIRTHDLLDDYLQKNNIGRLIYWYPREDLSDVIRRNSKDGIHQSGTTRIADNPQDGVVNRDLKLWGSSNVYVNSCSVFPTSSQANPTFFGGVCAVRMANHLSMKS